MNRTALALPLTLLPGLAAADVTPEDVWANLQAAYGAMGLSIAGDTARDGDMLTVTGGLATLTYPVIGGQATITMPRMELTDQGDGTVKVVTPPNYLVQVAADVPDEAEQLTFEMAIAQDGAVAVASGDPDDVTYTTSVDSFAMIINALQVPGMAIDMTMELESAGYDGVTQVTLGDNVTITSDLNNAPITSSFSMDIDGLQQQSTSSGGAMRTQTTLVLPPDLNVMNLTPALLAGLSLTSAVQSEASSGTTTSMLDGEFLSEQVQNTGPGTAEITFDATGFGISVDMDGFDAVVTQPELFPVPLEFQGRTVSGDFGFPLVASDTPQPFQYGFSITGLEIAEGLWGMFDPAQSLERAPMDMTFDLSGTLNWDLDTLDIPTLMQMGETNATPPIEILSADLNALAISVLGGAVNGTGAFTFDNTDLATFGGMPRPEGSATFSASGLNAVIDQLVASGFLPEDQAGMGRMFMGMFARSTGDDALETTVEINAEGHVILNGQRMR